MTQTRSSNPVFVLLGVSCEPRVVFLRHVISGDKGGMIGCHRVRARRMGPPSPRQLTQDQGRQGSTCDARGMREM
jgi:hypothetical protein